MLFRFYDKVLAEHIEQHRQMAFVSGPRQVGKTTTCREVDARHAYLNWDDQDDRRLLTRGPRAIVETLGFEQLGVTSRVLVLDELHKYPRWRTLLKGLFDKHADQLRIIVTGSSRLDLYRRGGDSLMGRYLLYRMHPLTVGELASDQPPGAAELRDPIALPAETAERLWEHGGYPEPLSKGDARFTRRWRTLRTQQLVREDIRELTQIQHIGQTELLVTLLNERSGCQLNYASLAREINVAVETVRRWVHTLCVLHHGFLVRPWFRNVAKSLRKEPKWFVRDWSGVKDPGQRAETFVACHLLKAVQTWEDLGLGTYKLCYLRDKLKREIDFVVIKDDHPWFLVEVKLSDNTLSPALRYFQRQTDAPHAFQAVMNAAWVDRSCFSRADPCVVPAATLLSQLP